MRNSIDMRSIFDHAQFQKIQDTLAVATGLAFIAVDYKGIPLTSHSACTEFCRMMRGSKYNKDCERCDSRGGLEAARSQEPYIYLCHAGLVDFAVPILYENNYLGAVMGGQVLLSDQADNLQLERMFSDNRMQILLPKESTLAVSNKIKIMNLDQIRKIAETVFLLCNLFVEETRLRNSLQELNRNSMFVHVDDCFFERYSQIVNNSCSNIHPSEKDTSELLKPAFSYIKNHLNEDLSLRKVSSVCNISPSYFSRIFARQGLGNYSEYVNRQKIMHAKRYLHQTDLSVTQIADKLGYCDSGYFIKTFKKYEGVTPSEFRNNGQSNPALNLQD